MTIVIRQVTANDLPSLDRDIKSAVGRSFDDELADQEQGVHTIHAAWLESEIIGAGFIRWLGPRDDRAAKLFPGAPEILRLDVQEKFRSQGIGRQLIRSMEQNASALGFGQVSLGVAHSNTRAYALYQQLGFQDTELTHYFDEYEYPEADGVIAHARDLCRYLVKSL